MAKISDIQKSLDINFVPFLTNYTQFLEKYCKETLYRETREDIKIEVVKLIFELKSLRAKRVPYDSITKAIIQSSKSNGSQGYTYLIAFIKECIQDLLVDFTKNVSNNERLDSTEIEDSENALIAFYKLAEHTSLAVIQYSSLYEETREDLDQYRTNIEKANSAISESNKLKSDMEVIQSTLKVSSEAVQKMEDKYSSIYTNSIAILGIFASFVFVMFGGFNTLSTVMGNLRGIGDSIVETLLIVSILVGFLITIVYTLILWIAKITGRQFVDKSCNCANRCNNLIHIMGRHRFYITLMGISFVTGLVTTCLLLKHIY